MTALCGRGRGRGRALGATVALGLLAGCAKDPPSTGTATSAPSASASTHASAAADAASSAHDLPASDAAAPKLACRVIAASSGDAGGGARMAKMGDLLAEDAFVVLADGARITAKHPRTTRESTVVGPAHARLCVGYEDETWLGSGTFKSSPGSGEAPGSEAWVVTARGVVRYGAADVTVAAVRGRLTVTVTSGTAYLWVLDAPARDAGAGPWTPLTGGSIEVGGVGSDDRNEAQRAKRAIEHCKAASDTARAIAASMTPDGGPPTGLATLAGAHVDARQEGRAACAVARLRVATLPAGDERAKLISSVDDAARWAALQ